MYPNENLRKRTSEVLTLLLSSDTIMSGAAGGWAGGIVCVVGSGRCGVLGETNADLEGIFGVTMGTIRKRACQISRELGLDGQASIETLFRPQEFTRRDEANAICAYASRNGPIEDVHADGRISDPEMKQLMIAASQSLEKLLAMKHEAPAEYNRFIRDYNRRFCRRWER